MDNTSTMKRPSHVNVNNDKANGITKETKVTNKNSGEKILESIANNGEIPQATNRAQRRAMAKREKKAQSKQKKRIIDYIRRHPEAVKVELDEDKIAEIEGQEEVSTGKRAELELIDEACDSEVIDEVVNKVNNFGFTPVSKNYVIDADFEEVKE